MAYKLKIQSIIFSTLFSLFLTNIASAEDGIFGMGDNLKLFAGVDAHMRNMKFEDQFGGQLFAERFGQYDIYGGIKLFQYFGLMIGHQRTREKQRDSIINEGEQYLGILLLPGDGVESHRSHAKLRGTHIDLMGFYPICPRYSVELFATAGLIRNHLQLEDHFYAQDGFLFDEPIVNHWDNKKTVTRLSAGVQATFFKHVGLRALIGWENTAKIKDLKPVEVPESRTLVNAKNSFIYGIGIFAIT